MPTKLNSLKNRPSNKPVTLKTLADHLGLSSQAVSQALRENTGTVRISPATRERVRTLALQLGYRQNRAALTLRNGKSDLFGVLHFGGLNMLGLQQLQCLVAEIKRYGTSPIIHYVINSSKEALNQAVETMLDLRVNGVLLSWPSANFSQSEVTRLFNSGIPVVALGGHWLSGIPRFYTDKEAGFAAITRHLIEQGYREITLLCGARKSHHPYTWHSTQAREGFRSAAKKYGRPDHRFHVHIISTDDAVEPFQKVDLLEKLCIPGYVGMKELIAKQQVPHALICQVDDWALGALRACSEAGIRVPHDMAITGFENNPTSCAGCVPLTTVAQPLPELSRLAVDRLAELAHQLHKNSPPPADVTQLPGQLIVRQSSLREPIVSPW